MKTYEVLQHGDDLRYYVRNKHTGRHVVEHVSFSQATKTAKALEARTEEASWGEETCAGEWPRELDIDTKG
jgi:hypothetical protein